MVSASQDDTVQIWDAHTGSQLFIYEDHVNAVAWSRDGKRIAWGDEATVQVRDAHTGSQLFTYDSSSVYTLAWSLDSTRIASGGYDTTVQVWRSG